MDEQFDSNDFDYFDYAMRLLERTLPMLERLGDFIGNGPEDPDRPGSHGQRCDLILDIKRFRDEVESR